MADEGLEEIQKLKLINAELTAQTVVVKNRNLTLENRNKDN